MSTLSKEEIKKIANLGRLSLTEEEEEKLSGDLSAVLGYVEQLSELNTDGVEPMIGAVTHIKERREDIVEDSGLQAKMLENAPEAEGTAIKVPKMN